MARVTLLCPSSTPKKNTQKKLSDFTVIETFALPFSSWCIFVAPFCRFAFLKLFCFKKMSDCVQPISVRQNVDWGKGHGKLFPECTQKSSQGTPISNVHFQSVKKNGGAFMRYFVTSSGFYHCCLFDCWLYQASVQVVLCASDVLTFENLNMIYCV